MSSWKSKTRSAEHARRLKRESVVNWVRDWMNHGTMIPELSVLVTESISTLTRVYYVEFDDWSGSASPG
jgi:hypothetical protein